MTAYWYLLAENLVGEDEEHDYRIRSKATLLIKKLSCVHYISLTNSAIFLVRFRQLWR
jgi:hypothetical protein